MIKKYLNWFIGALTSYGVYTFITSQASFLLAFINQNHFLYIQTIGGIFTLVWLILYTRCLKRTSLIDTLQFKNRKPFFILLLTFVTFATINVTLDRPLYYLVSDYNLSFVSLEDEKDVEISHVHIDGQNTDLATFQSNNNWKLNETLTATDDTALTISNLRNEQVTVTFVKQSSGGIVGVYHDEKLVEVIDLESAVEYQIGQKFSKDFYFLLIPAVFGTFLAIYLLLLNVITLLHDKSERVKQLSHQLSNHFILKSKISTLYTALPLLFLALFNYFSLLNVSIRPYLLLLYFVSILVAEQILYKKENVFRQRYFYQTIRAIFYLLYTSIITVLILGIIYYYPEFDLSLEWLTNYVSVVNLSSTVVLSSSVLVFSLFNNYFIGVGLSVIFFIISGISNYYKMLMVGEPIYGSDLAMVSNFDDILVYTQEIVSPLLFLFIFIILCLLFIVAFRYKKIYRVSAKNRILLFGFSAIYLVSIFNYENTPLSLVVNNTVNFVKWNQLSNYEQNGFILGFITNLQNEIMLKPDKYSKEDVEKISAYYEERAKAYNDSLSDVSTPNILVVVSESLSDPTAFSQLTFSEDPLHNIKTFMNEHTSGTFVSPFKGNRTANIEFEVLMGFSNALLLEGTVPFQQALSSMNEIPSLLQHLTSFGYSSTAIHPNNASFYKRSLVYPALGFDRFLSIELMTHLDLIESEKYVSDEAVFKEMLDVLYAEENPAFVYGLTMQNHIPTFENKFGQTTIDVTDSTNNVDIEIEMENYAEGLKLTDEAFNSFIHEINHHDEDTIVIFFGDHLVNFSSNLHANHGFIEGNTDADTATLFFETPLLIMANYESFDMDDLGSVSPIFIAPLLLEELGLPLSPFHLFLLTLYDELTVIHKDFILDSNGSQNAELTQVQAGLLTMFELIMYDLLEGEQYISSSFYEIP